LVQLKLVDYIKTLKRGRICEFKRDYQNAKMCYQNALSMNPYHIQSLKQLAVVLAEMKQFNLSEKMIQDAIAINSSLPELWNILAQILEFLEDNQSAMKCFQTCIQLEATDPILPFTSLTRLF
jgi:tetratricopeptide (TPR) repeat protein